MAAARWPIAVRLVLAIAVGAAGIAGALRSLGSALRVDRPELACRIAPGDARIAGTQALALVQNGDAADEALAGNMARQALRRDIGNIPATVALGTLADQRGDIRRARALFGYAQFWARRDLFSQLWLIQDAVNRGDVKGALRHYDYALRAAPLAQKILFPILARSLAAPEVRGEVIDLLARRPRWGASFMEATARLGPDYAAVGETFAALVGRKVAIPQVAQQALLAQLNATAGLEAAWRFDRRLRGGPAPLIRNAEFAPERATASLFDWQIAPDEGISAGLSDRAGAGGALSFDVPPGGVGRLASQLLVLPAGRYHLASQALFTQGTPGVLSWRLVCVAGDVPLGSAAFEPAARGGATAASAFSVPANCHQQRLDLAVSLADDSGALSGQVLHVDLAAAGEAKGTIDR
jgi:hypothetical protein